MEIKAVKFRKDGFYTQPFAFGGEKGPNEFDRNIRYRGSLQNYLIKAKGHTKGNSIIVVENDGLFYMLHGDITYVDEALYEDKLSVVFDDLSAARETQDRIREFVRNHPTVYCGTHTPQGYENLEAKRVMDLDHPVQTVLAEVDFSKQQASGKYVCSICGYVYDPAEHDGVAFEDLPDDWRCPRCRQGKEKFNRA